MGRKKQNIINPLIMPTPQMYESGLMHGDVRILPAIKLLKVTSWDIDANQ